MADTPAAAAAPATPAPAASSVPSTPSGKSPAPFDARLALAKSIGVPRVDGEPVREAATTAAGGNIDADPDADPPAGDGDPVAAEGEDGAAGDGADGAAADDGEAPTPDAQLQAVVKAFEAGDIEAMAKALEKPGVKVSGPVKRAFRAFARRDRQLNERQQAQDQRDREFNSAREKAVATIADDSRRISAQERGLIQRFGWAHQLEAAWEAEDMLAVGKAIERGCKGASLATITQKLATGKQGKSPEEQRLADERRKFEEEKNAAANKTRSAEDAKITAQRRDAAVTRVGEGLKTHPYLQTVDKAGGKVMDQEALNEVFTAYEASWNGEKFTKTARQCADELQERLVTRAAARGLAPATAAPANGKTGKPAAGKTAAKPAARPVGKEPPRVSSSGKAPLDLDQTRANRVAMAKRVTDMQRRGVVAR